MSHFRASVYTAGIVAAVAVLALGVLAGSAFGQSWCKDKPHKEKAPAPSSSSKCPVCAGAGEVNKPDRPKGDHESKPRKAEGHDNEGSDNEGSDNEGSDNEGSDNEGSDKVDQPDNEDQPSIGVQPSIGNQPTTTPAAVSTPVPGPSPVSTGLLPAAPEQVVVPATSAPAAPAPEVKGTIGTRVNNPAGGHNESSTNLVAAAAVTPVAAGQGGLASTGLDILPVGLLGGLALGGSAFFFRRAGRC